MGDLFAESENFQGYLRCLLNIWALQINCMTQLVQMQLPFSSQRSSGWDLALPVYSFTIFVKPDNDLLQSRRYCGLELWTSGHSSLKCFASLAN